ncbi:YhgE/Pip family protein [Subtercola boreus]|uniref:YhgE/Pip domain-containing protein n=1 Tax=Subtercola boreus TaxID=120213 RepID=A0A3E0WBP3_9MICO|nr:YhgE/Pip family protein [Subtercola boreus]RFA19466.1 hypothetical protein B7R24_12570 [Subtercola boreus]RFA19727.1 hypothetical protein B7R23_12550 [Subtercola boreus]RFA26093.1 hypothetical protein B7R25_12670 [Subtercola boreus]
MSTLSTLLKSVDRAPRSSAARLIALVLAVATPLLVAGVAVSTFAGADAAGASSTPDAVRLPAAVVNLDTPIQTTIGGKEVPVAAGKLLTSQLMTGDAGSGFAWTITNAADAQSGLDAGTYSAVVTIPSNFSTLYISSQGSTPTAAPLAVTTNGAQSYVADLLATALATNVHEALATSLTQSYVKGMLSGFTSLHSQLDTAATQTGTLGTVAGQVNDGAGKLSTGVTGLNDAMARLNGGVGELAAKTDQLPKATTDLAGLATLARDGSALLSSGLTETARKQDAIEADQLALNLRIASLSTDLPSLAPAEIAARVAEIKKASDDVALSSVGIGLDLHLGAVAGSALKDGTALVSTGNTALADSMPLLSTGIDQLQSVTGQLADGTAKLDTATSQLALGTAGVATGVGQLQTGLGQAAAAVPSYTDEQQAALSTVVTTPVVTTITDSRPLPSAQVATASVMVPVALWLGAFALYLLLTPFTAQALTSQASAARILRQSLLPALGLGVLQALAVIVGLQVLGVASANPLGSALFIVGVSVTFVAVHQGLIALLGRVGRMISLAFLVLQVAVAGVLVPAALSPSWFQTVSSFLPLSAAVRGMQGLLTGAGADGGAAIGGVIAVLVVIALIGVTFTVVAISRRRSVTSLSSGPPLARVWP